MTAQRALPARYVPARLVFGGIAGLFGPGVVAWCLFSFGRGLFLNVYTIIALIPAGCGILLYLAAVLSGLFLHPDTASLAGYQAERAKARPAVSIDVHPPDPAWPRYSLWQAYDDRQAVRWHLVRLFNRVLRVPGEFIEDRPGGLAFWFLVFPVLAVVIVFLGVAGLAAGFCFGIYWVVFTAWMAVNRFLGGLLALCLRGIDRMYRRVRGGTQVMCLHCYHGSRWPAYLCPSCSRVHRDVRPGRLGLLSRRCECGARFPAMASRAGRLLRAVCPRCGQPLAARAGLVREIRIPVFGDTWAAETPFLYAALKRLWWDAERAGILFSVLDRAAFQSLRAIRSDYGGFKIPVTAPSSVTVRLDAGRRSRLVQLFDLASEGFFPERRNDPVRLLHDVQGVVYVLDPFTIPGVRAQLAGRDDAAIPLAHAARQNPEIVMAAISQLPDRGGRSKPARLAVVISRTDQLRDAGLAVPTESSGIAAWLGDEGMGNVLRAAQIEFAEVRFFADAAQETAGDRLADAGAPLRWLLAANGVRVPAAAVPPSGQWPDGRAASVADDHLNAVLTDRANVTQGGRTDWDPFAAADDEPASRSGGENPGAGSPGPEPGDGGPPARRYLRARCPDTVSVGKPFSLLASIIQDDTETATQLFPFDVPAQGQNVLLVLYAPGLRLLSDQRLTVHVPATGDSSPVMFELRADEGGARSVSITAWLGGSCLGELLVAITADRDCAGGRHREFRAEIETEASEGAVGLVVRYDPDLKAYRFEFRDEDNPNEVVSRLSFEPRQRIERLVADLDRLAAGRTGYSPDQARDYLVNAGAELWRELVPQGLREQFWDRQHRIRQLTILADKDTVPWELLYPRDPGRDEGFLVQQFPVTRAIFGRRPASRLSLWPARFVLPHGSLPGAEAEIDTMRRLLDPAQAPQAVISELTPLQELIRAGDFGLLHFACHNRFGPDDDASIRLGNVPFTPRFMTTAVIDKVLARSAPTVFMNACRSAGLAPTYNRLDGWASKFLEAGAGAFIGSLWAVTDGTAREFAEELYAQLKTGAPLGTAIMDARTKAATHAADPTWLAYSAYGDPRAKVMLP